MTLTLAGIADADQDDLLAPEPAKLTGSLIGYARVSTSGQILDRQTHALTEADCIRVFTMSMEIVLPRPEALPFVPDAKASGAIAFAARRRYRDEAGFDASLYGSKVRRLIDDHVEELGIEQKIPPISITATDFDTKVAGPHSDRAKAPEMEHAIRYHLREHWDEDPEHYARLSERLEEIIEELGEQWEQLAHGF